MQLLKSQLNIIYDRLIVNQLLPSDFEITSSIIGGKYQILGSCVNYRSDNYFFNCGYQDELFFMRYSPSEKSIVNELYTPGWDNVLRYVDSWISCLKLETSQPDKWALLKKSIDTANIKVVNSFETFSYQEVLEIDGKIKTLKEQIKNIPFSIEQSSLINEKLDHLVELAKTANKFDWGSFFIGNIMSIIITLSVTPENAQLLWEAIKHVFNNYILLN